MLRTWQEWAFGSGGFGLNPYSGTWFDTVLFSARRVLQGFFWACVAGIPLGIWIGWSALAAAAIDPLIQLLRPIPITAWLPFSIAVFGIRDIGAVFLIALGAFYPIVVNTTHGARDIGRNLIRAARMMGAGARPPAAVVFPVGAAVDLHRPAAGPGRRLDGGHRGRDGRREVRPRLRAVGRLLRRPHGHGAWPTWSRSACSGFLSDRLISWSRTCVLHWRTLRVVRPTPMSATVIRERRRKTYAGRSRCVALEDIDLAMRDGEFVALLGPSGCGKSTLLNIVAGFEQPTRGAVHDRRRSRSRDPGPDRGVVFQEPALFPWLTVLRQRRVRPAHAAGQARRRVPQRAATSSSWSGCDGFEATIPAELSGGMKQRVGIARVLVRARGCC